MLDLIDADGRALRIMREKYPDALFEDASDFNHEHRFSIDLEVEQTEYFRFLLDSKLAFMSLSFQIEFIGNPMRVAPIIDDWLKQNEKATVP